MTIKALLLIAAAAGVMPATTALAESRSFVIIGRGATGSTSDLAFTVLEEALKRTFPQDTVQIRRLPGTAAAAPPRVQSGEAQFGHGVGENVLDAWTGTRTFDGHAPMRDMRYLGSYLGFLKRPSASPTFVTKTGSGIESWADLAKRRIGVGPADSLTSTMVEVGLGGVGLSYDTINANGGLVMFGDWNQQFEMLGDGQLDAVFLTADHPSPILTQFSANNSPTLVNMSEDVFAALMARYPTFSHNVMPANTYNWQPQEVRGVQLSLGYIVHKDVPDDIVHALCRQLYVGDGAKVWGDVVPSWAGAESEAHRAAGSVFIPIHPGAKRCYDEAGIAITHMAAGNDTP